jgi:hypothetical protein
MKHAVGMQPKYSTYGTVLGEDIFLQSFNPDGVY